MNYRDIISSDTKVLIISKKHCPSCDKLKRLFETINIEFKVYEYQEENDQQLLAEIKENTKGTKFPFCYIDGKYMGNYEKIEHLLITDKLKRYLDYEIDF